MIKQKGIIYFPVLLIIVLLLIFILVVYLGKKTQELSIEPPSLFTLSAYLNTTEGKKLLYTKTFGVANEADKEKILSNIGSRLTSSSFLDKAIISLQDQGIYFFDKTTRILQTIPLPKEIEILKNTKDPFSLELFAEELNEQYYLINFSYNQKDHYTYLFDKENSKLIHLKQFDDECKYIYCGGPEILKRVSENDFVFIQGAGDACWSAGVLHRFNLETKKPVKLFEYSNGCSAEFDSYFGMFENSFIRAKHSVLDSYSAQGAGPDQEVLEIYATDLNGQRAELIPDSKVPGKIDYLSLNPENNTLYLFSNAENKYYGYNLNDHTLKTVTKDRIVEPTKQSKNKDQAVEDSLDFLTFEVTGVEIGDVVKVYTQGQSVGIKDSLGNGVPIVADAFLDEVRFERETRENCLYQRSRSLADKKYPFRFASHEYEDSAEVLNKDEIIFVVISKCSEYPSKNDKKNEWFLGAKQFILNIRTGKTILKSELTEPVYKSAE